MNFLDQLQSDIKKGREIGKKRREEESRRKAFKPPKRPRTPNKLLLQIGIWWDRFSPVAEVFSEVMRFIRRDLRKVIQYAKNRKSRG